MEFTRLGLGAVRAGLQNGKPVLGVGLNYRRYGVDLSLLQGEMGATSQFAVRLGFGERVSEYESSRQAQYRRAAEESLEVRTAAAYASDRARAEEASSRGDWEGALGLYEILRATRSTTMEDTQMKPTPNDGRHPRERGAIAAFTGIVLMTLVGMTVVGVVLGRLAFTATEVQAVAEVAATGYARSWLNTLASGGSTNYATHAGEAMQVIDGNNINGDAAESANIQGYERGRYEFTTNGPFVPGGSPENAVRATATETVTNFFGALFGTPETTVTKTAVATLTCGSRARTLPPAVGDCQFEGFDGPEDCDDLPSLTQQNAYHKS